MPWKTTEGGRLWYEAEGPGRRQACPHSCCYCFWDWEGKGRAQHKCCTPLLSPMCCVRDRAGTPQCHIPVATTRLATSRHKTDINFYSQGLWEMPWGDSWSLAQNTRSALALSHFVDGSGSLPVLLSLQQVHEPLFARADACSLPWPACAGPSSIQEQLCGLTVPVSSTGKLLGFLAHPSADWPHLTTPVTFTEQGLERYWLVVLLHCPLHHCPWGQDWECHGLRAHGYQSWVLDRYGHGAGVTSPWDFWAVFQLLLPPWPVPATHSWQLSQDSWHALLFLCKRWGDFSVRDTHWDQESPHCVSAPQYFCKHLREGATNVVNTTWHLSIMCPDQGKPSGAETNLD